MWWRRQCSEKKINKNKSVTTLQSRKVFFPFFFPERVFEGEQMGRSKRSVWLNLRLTCGTGEIDEVPLSFTLCGEQGQRNRTLQCGGPGLRARSRRGVPRLINGTGGPSKTALPTDGARRCSKNNQAEEAGPASGSNRLQLLSFWRIHASIWPGEGVQPRGAVPTPDRKL